MVDVVGLRFVTEGQKEALASLELYERGIRSLSNVQDRAVAEMNRSRRADMQAFALNQRLKQQALREEERQQAAAARAVQQAAAQAARAVAQRDAEERRAFQNYLRYQRERENAARAEARAQEQAAAQAARAVAQRDAEDRRAFQQYLQTQNERERVAKETARAEEQAAQQAARAQQQAVQAYNQLRAATDPVFAAKQRVAQAEATVQQALARGIITRDEAARTMAQYRLQVEMTTGALAQNAAAHQIASRGMNGTGMAMQQVGYQVGDFLVQVQSGTNAFVAFGQQATQLVGILPLMGAGFMGLSMGALVALSAGLGIAIPLVTALGAVFLRTRQSAQDAASGVDDLEQSIRSLDSALQDWLRSREAARLGITADELLGIGSMEDAEAGLRAAREELERLRAVRDALASAPASPEGVIMGLLSRRNADNGGVQAEIAALAALIEAENRLATLRARQGELQFRNFSERLTQYQEELVLQRAVAQFGEGSDQARQVRLEQTIAAEFRRIEALREANEITDAQAVALRIVAEESARAADESERLSGEAAATQRIIELLSNADMGGLVGQINNVAGAMGIAADEAARLVGGVRALAVLRAQGGGGRGGDPRQFGPAPEGLFVPTPAIVAEADQLINERRRAAAGIGVGGGGGGGGGGATQELVTLESIVATMTQRIERERELIGLHGQARREVEIRRELEDQLRESGQSYTEEQIANAARQIAAQEEVNNALRRQAEQMQQIGQTMESALTSGFMSIVDGTKSASEAFRDMARQIVAELFRVLVVQQLVGQFRAGGGGILGAVFGSVNANGNAFAGGNVMPYANGAVFANLNRGPANVVPFAKGGVVSAPMTFPMSGGRTGLMGEAGPEAIMPLKRGRDGKLGVASQNMGLNVTVTMDPSTGALGAFVRNEAGQVVAQAAPRIVDASKAAVVDARKRGGTMRQTFK